MHVSITTSLGCNIVTLLNKTSSQALKFVFLECTMFSTEALMNTVNTALNVQCAMLIAR